MAAEKVREAVHTATETLVAAKWTDLEARVDQITREAGENGARFAEQKVRLFLEAVADDWDGSMGSSGGGGSGGSGGGGSVEVLKLQMRRELDRLENRLLVLQSHQSHQSTPIPALQNHAGKIAAGLPARVRALEERMGDQSERVIAEVRSTLNTKVDERKLNKFIDDVQGMVDRLQDKVRSVGRMNNEWMLEATLYK